MITANDRKILRHIDAYKFITIEQAKQLAFPDMKRGYEYARTRLQNLVTKEKRLKVIHNSALKLKLFIDIDSDIKSISAHRIYLLDFYCSLLKSGVEIERFELEKQWLGGKIRSDAFCVYMYGGYRFRNLVEVNTSQNKINLGRYDEAKDEILTECGGKELPRVVLLDDRRHMHYDTKQYQVVRLDYDLNNFPEIFL
jgi:hypothetical protein